MIRLLILDKLGSMLQSRCQGCMKPFPECQITLADVAPSEKQLL